MAKTLQDLYQILGDPAALTDTLTNPVAWPARALTYEFNGTTWDRIRSLFTQTTAGITANGAGSPLNMATTPCKNYTMMIDRTVGATDVVEIDLEGSIDGTDFAQIATITSLVGEPVTVSAINLPYSVVRYNVVTVGAGNTLQIHLLAVR